MIGNMFSRLGQLPWKILLTIVVVSITLHLTFFPETRQSIVRLGQSDKTLHNDEPAPVTVPIQNFYPPINPHPQVPENVETHPDPIPDPKPEPIKPVLEPVSSAVVNPVKPTSAPKPETAVEQVITAPKTGEYIALCMAIKDQHLDLGEFFVHHYHHIGIQRFYIQDDGSDPPMSSFEYPGVPRETLTFIYHDAANHSKHFEQGLNYRRCMKDYGPMHTWMGFLDGDEFVEMTGKYTLHEMLHALERNNTVGQLVMNWRMHSSGGLLKRPLNGARKGFVECISDETTDDRLSDNQHVKPFVRVDFAKEPKGAHMFHLKKGYITVGEHGDVVDTLAWRNPITRDRVALHHYAVKSREEYEEKMLRGNGEDVPKSERFWFMVEKAAPHVPCPEMAKYDP